MRILHLSNHCYAGNGNVHVAVDLACRQADKGHHLAFASGRGAYVELLRSRGIDHWDLPHGRIGIWRNARAIARAVVLCRKFRPDVIHAHMMAGAIIGAICSKVTGAPLVTTVHNSFDRHSTLMCLGDRIVAVSAAERDALVARGFPSNKVETVLNGTRGSLRESALAQEKPIELERPCVLTAAGLHGRKGVDVLIKAFSVAAASAPDWHLYISGDGDDRPALERLAKAGGVGDRIHFLGFRNQPQRLLEQADVFSLASYADPCSLVLCEARNAGCAIVATAVGGTPEILNFGAAGRLVPPGDVSALAEALAGLMHDPAALRQARSDSKRNNGLFSVDRMAVDYDQVYARAVQRKPFEAPLIRASG